MIVSADQGSQLTGESFTSVLKGAKVAISGDEGRAMDNVMVERSWRSVRYEEVEGPDPRGVAALGDRIDRVSPWPFLLA